MAFSSWPWAICQRGDSGMNQMEQMTITQAKHCKMKGIRHEKSLSMLLQP
jgi:hypothetical protein